MIRKAFYNDASYRKKQSKLTKLAWKRGVHDSRRTRVKHGCKRAGCSRIFITIPSNPKKYCSSACAAIVNNSGRVQSRATKIRISLALKGKTYPNRPKTPFMSGICINPKCRKRFTLTYWRPSSRPARFCSNRCSISMIGSRPISPKAVRAKAGIREDIDPKLYFFSRWEANYARILNFEGTKWVFQPRVFKLKTQNYTPDFYLPKTSEYIEIKNYLSDYSRNRDEEFRELYPKTKLKLILKKDYLKLQKKYSDKIEHWEFYNSKS